MNAPLTAIEDTPTEPLSTGSLRLDLALQTGGILPGELVVFEGVTGSGKTVLCQHIVAEAQRRGGVCAWIDSDHSLDPAFAMRCGIDPDRLYVVQPPDAETAMAALFALTFSRSMMVIVVDSADSLIAREEIETRLDARRPTAYPEEELLSQGLGRIAPYLLHGWTRVVFTRGAIPDYGPSYHQLSKRMSRMALGLRATARIELKDARPIESGSRVLGQRVSARVLRPLDAWTRIGLPSDIPAINPSEIAQKPPECAKIPQGCVQTDLDIMYNQGIIKIGEVFDLSIALGLTFYRNNCFIIGSRELGPDRATAIQSLQTLELAAPLEQVIRQKLLWN